MRLLDAHVVKSEQLADLKENQGKGKTVSGFLESSTNMWVII